MELSAGTRVGPYEIQRRIGEGGMGVVYSARDGRLGRQVAIKVLPAAVVADAGRLRRFEQEARTIGGLNHPNLVTLHDVGHHDDAPYLVTELLDGMSLQARLVAGPIPRKQVIEIATEIAHGLAAAHGAGIVHRDIKPDNVFVLGDGRVKILDFGIAKLRRDDLPTDLANAPTGMQSDTPGTAATGIGMVIGTPGYMAPEQLAGGTVGPRTDLFALGVVFYEMLARKRPFAGDSNIEESYGILKHEPGPLPPSVPTALARIVLRCLEKRPDARFQSAADLAFALDALDDVSAGRSSSPSLVQPAIEPTAPMPAITPPATIVARRAGASKAWIVAIFGIAVAGALGFAWIVRAPSRHGTSGTWPSLVEGGPVYRRVTYHPQADWYARFSPDGKSILYSVRDNSTKVEDLDPKAQERDRWSIMRSLIERPSVISEHVNGRLLDVRLVQGLEQIALRKPLRDVEGGVLATVEIGTGAPLERAPNVRDASFGPGDDIAIVRTDRTGSIVEYPIGTKIWSGDGELRFPRVSPDGKHVAVVQHTDADPEHHLIVLDAHGAKRAVTSRAGISGVAWANDHEVWYSAGSTIYALDLDHESRVLLRGQLRLELRDVDRKGRILVAPIDERYQLFIGSPDGAFSAMSWLDAAVVESISADGKTIAFRLGNGADHTPEGDAIYLRNSDEPMLLGHGLHAALVPDGSAAIVLCATGAPLRLMSAVGRSTKPLSTKGIEHVDLDHAISISSDGKFVIVRGATGKHTGRAWAISIDGGDPIAIGLAKDTSRAYAVSADHVAYAEDHGVSLTSLTGDNPVKLDAPHGEVPLRFSADGKYLFVTRQHSWPRSIERIELATSTRTPWVTLPISDKPEEFDLAISDDGQVIAYSISVQTSDLYVIEPPK